jgi:hypothetical protein
VLDHLPGDYKGKWLSSGCPILQVVLDFPAEEDMDWERVFPAAEPAPPLREPPPLPPRPALTAPRPDFLSSDSDAAYEALLGAADEAAPGPVPTVPEFQPARRDDPADLHVFVIEFIRWATPPLRGARTRPAASSAGLDGRVRVNLRVRHGAVARGEAQAGAVKPAGAGDVRLALGAHGMAAETFDDAQTVLRPSLDVAGPVELAGLPERTPVALTRLIHAVEAPSTTTRGGSPLTRAPSCPRPAGVRHAHHALRGTHRDDTGRALQLRRARRRRPARAGTAGRALKRRPLPGGLAGRQLHRHSLSALKGPYDAKGATNATRACAALVAEPHVRPSCPLHRFALQRQRAQPTPALCPRPARREATTSTLERRPGRGTSACSSSATTATRASASAAPRATGCLACVQPLSNAALRA